MEEAALTAHGKYSSLQVGTSHLGSVSETYGGSLLAHNNHMRALISVDSACHCWYCPLDDYWSTASAM